MYAQLVLLRLNLTKQTDFLAVLTQLFSVVNFGLWRGKKVFKHMKLDVWELNGRKACGSQWLSFESSMLLQVDLKDSLAITCYLGF